MDTSSSMAGGSLKEVKAASIEFVRRQSGTNRQFAVVQFNSSARTDEKLTGKPDPIEAAINRFLASGGTRLDFGLEESKNALGLYPLGTSKVQNFVVIFTDGMSSAPTEDLRISLELRKEGVIILAIYTPGAKRDHLVKVAGDKSLVFPTSAGSFGDAFKKVEALIEGRGKVVDPNQINANSKIVKVKQASTRFVRRQKTNQLNIAVLHFGDEAAIAQSLTTNTVEIVHAIDKLLPKGETALDLGLKKAREELPLEGGDTVIDTNKPEMPRDYVVVFTDGKPNDEAAALAVADDLRSKGVQIFSIHTADAPGNFLARLTGDPSRVISTTSRSIDEAFIEVEKAIAPSAGIAISSTGGKVESLLKNGVWFALLAMALALSLTMAQNKLTAGGGATRGLSSGQFLTALFIGGVAGFAAGGMNMLFNLMSVNKLALFAGGVLAWGILAALIGLAMIFVIANFSAGRAIAGGLVGGLVGGTIFNIIRLAQGGSSTGELIGRLLGAMVVGAMIGLFIAWIEQLTRKAWLAVYWTPKQHSTINLGEKRVTIGGGQDDIRIKGLGEGALSILLSGGRVLCTRQPGNKQVELKDQSSIKLGKVRLVIHSKTVE
jgi:Ca-activated chloride channel family protein